MASRLAQVNEVTVNDVLDGRKLLEIGCVDRVYLTLPVPGLVAGGQVVSFLSVDRDNDGAVINAFCRRSRVKACLRDGRALRAETVINDARDIGVLRRLDHFGELTAKVRRPPGHGPGRRLVLDPVRRLRPGGQEPACLDRPAARHALQPQPDD